MGKKTFVRTSSYCYWNLCFVYVCVCEWVCVCVCVSMYVYKTCDQYLAYHVEIHVDNSKEFPYIYGLHLYSRMDVKFSMQLRAVIYLTATRITLI